MCLVWRHFRFSIFLEVSYLYIWLVWRQAVSSEAQRSGKGYLHESRDCVISRVGMVMLTRLVRMIMMMDYLHMRGVRKMPGSKN